MAPVAPKTGPRDPIEWEEDVDDDSSIEPEDALNRPEDNVYQGSSRSSLDSSSKLGGSLSQSFTQSVTPSLTPTFLSGYGQDDERSFVTTGTGLNKKAGSRSDLESFLGGSSRSLSPQDSDDRSYTSAGVPAGTRVHSRRRASQERNRKGPPDAYRQAGSRNGKLQRSLSDMGMNRPCRRPQKDLSASLSALFNESSSVQSSTVERRFSESQKGSNPDFRPDVDAQQESGVSILTARGDGILPRRNSGNSVASELSSIVTGIPANTESAAPSLQTDETIEKTDQEDRDDHPRAEAPPIKEQSMAPTQEIPPARKEPETPESPAPVALKPVTKERRRPPETRNYPHRRTRSRSRGGSRHDGEGRHSHDGDERRHSHDGERRSRGGSRQDDERRHSHDEKRGLGGSRHDDERRHSHDEKGGLGGSRHDDERRHSHDEKRGLGGSRHDDERRHSHDGGERRRSHDGEKGHESDRQEAERKERRHEPARRIKRAHSSAVLRGDGGEGGRPVLRKSKSMRPGGDEHSRIRRKVIRGDESDTSRPRPRDGPARIVRRQPSDTDRSRPARRSRPGHGYESDRSRSTAQRKPTKGDESDVPRTSKRPGRRPTRGDESDQSRTRGPPKRSSARAYDSDCSRTRHATSSRDGDHSRRVRRSGYDSEQSRQSRVLKGDPSKTKPRKPGVAGYDSERSRGVRNERSDDLERRRRSDDGERRRRRRPDDDVQKQRRRRPPDEEEARRRTRKHSSERRRETEGGGKSGRDRREHSPRRPSRSSERCAHAREERRSSDRNRQRDEARGGSKTREGSRTREGSPRKRASRQREGERRELSREGGKRDPSREAEKRERTSGRPSRPRERGASRSRDSRTRNGSPRRAGHSRERKARERSSSRASQSRERPRRAQTNRTIRDGDQSDAAGAHGAPREGQDTGQCFSEVDKHATTQAANNDKEQISDDIESNPAHNPAGRPSNGGASEERNSDGLQKCGHHQPRSEDVNSCPSKDLQTEHKSCVGVETENSEKASKKLSAGAPLVRLGRDIDQEQHPELETSAEDRVSLIPAENGSFNDSSGKGLDSESERDSHDRDMSAVLQFDPNRQDNVNYVEQRADFGSVYCIENDDGTRTEGTIAGMVHTEDEEGVVDSEALFEGEETEASRVDESKEGKESPPLNSGFNSSEVEAEGARNNEAARKKFRGKKLFGKKKDAASVPTWDGPENIGLEDKGDSIAIELSTRSEPRRPSLFGNVGGNNKAPSMFGLPREEGDYAGLSSDGDSSGLDLSTRSEQPRRSRTSLFGGRNKHKKLESVPTMLGTTDGDGSDDNSGEPHSDNDSDGKAKKATKTGKLSLFGSLSKSDNGDDELDISTRSERSSRLSSLFGGRGKKKALDSVPSMLNPSSGYEDEDEDEDEDEYSDVNSSPVKEKKTEASRNKQRSFFGRAKNSDAAAVTHATDSTSGENEDPQNRTDSKKEEETTTSRNKKPGHGASLLGSASKNSENETLDVSTRSEKPVRPSLFGRSSSRSNVMGPAPMSVPKMLDPPSEDESSADDMSVSSKASRRGMRRQRSFFRLGKKNDLTTPTSIKSSLSLGKGPEVPPSPMTPESLYGRRSGGLSSDDEDSLMSESASAYDCRMYYDNDLLGRDESEFSESDTVSMMSYDESERDLDQDESEHSNKKHNNKSSKMKKILRKIKAAPKDKSCVVLSTSLDDLDD